MSFRKYIGEEKKMDKPYEPMIKLDPDGAAPVLSYNVPEPTSYTGTNIIELNFEDTEIFKDAPKGVPLVRAEDYTVDKIAKIMADGFNDPKLFAFVKLNRGRIWLAGSGDVTQVTHTPDIQISKELQRISPSGDVFYQLKQGLLLNVYTDMYGVVTCNWVPIPMVNKQRILLVERHRLSSFLGSYGAGRTIKTFTLLPGEKTRISIKTYSRKEQDIKNASSILDSFDQTSTQDFEKSVQAEQSDKRSASENMSYYVDAEANFNWGWGSAGVKAGVKGGTNSSREEFAKNLSNATQKHASKASAKRDVQVNTSSEVKEQQGEETEIVREIQNINVSRTLNFVFRQMNQEYITILHLADVRLAYWNGDPADKQEFTLPQLETMLERYVKPEHHAKVRDAIVSELSYVFDYKDQSYPLIEERALLKDPTKPAEAEGNLLKRYLRVRKDLQSTYSDPQSKTKITVPGIILFADKNVMRTDGIIVDAILGAGDGLDAYSHGLQDETIREKMLGNNLREGQILREKLGQRLVAEKLADQAKIFHDCFIPALAADANGSKDGK